MKANYNPSVNIVRDADREFNYIPTPNAKSVVNQLAEDFKKGIRSFNIIGSYGTGKSSFLLALEQSLLKQKPYFEPNFITKPKIELIKIVGSYQSIIDSFAQVLNIAEKENKPEHVLTELLVRYRGIESKSPLFFIVIDEFGKFLEYATQNRPEIELYFVQQLAEFVNNADYNFVFVTTIHQSFESYGYSLTKVQRQEWSKVKGRFKEIIFSEPVEQLLYLASEHIEKKRFERPRKSLLSDSFKIFSDSKAFTQNESYSKEVGSKIYPLDIAAANVLTQALQRYGQNERSLFSFLEATDFTSLDRFRQASSPFYSLPQVYDYLNFNLYSYLTSHHNPDFSVLSIIKRSIEEVERAFDKNIDYYLKLVKTIGLLNIFAAAGATLDLKFITSYAELCLGIRDAGKLVKDLENAQIIFYRKHSKRYILFEGTDLDIHSALREAGDKISNVTDVASLLRKYFDLEPVLAKRYSYENGCPRKFAYVISNEPHDEIPVGEIDGFINLLFNEKLTEGELLSISQEQKEAIIYCYYSNTNRIKELLHDLEKTVRVLQENKDDKVAKRELEKIYVSQKDLLNHYILHNMLNGSSDVLWFWSGKRVSIQNDRQFKGLLSSVCSSVYHLAPVFKNELVNKHKVSSQIGTARKQFFKALVNNWALPDLGFETTKFPPEKTIYLTLLKENHLEPFVDEVNRELQIDEHSSFAPLWKYSNAFLSSSTKEMKSVAEFISGLNVRPFKLKQGLIDFWVPSFLFLRREDFALYSIDGFIPELSEDTLDLIVRNPEEYYIKAFNLEGIRLDIFNSYRIFLNQDSKSVITNQTFVETIKPFLTFYRGLKDYSKNTKRLSSEALALRLVIATAKDPEKTFFEDFPAALGTNLKELESDDGHFKSYIVCLQGAIRELRTSLERLYDRFEQFIQNEIVYEVVDFEVYKGNLQSRYKTIKKHLLIPHQVRFIMRVDSMLDDRNAWLSSLAQALTSKSLENFDDSDELLLYDRFKAIIVELDSLSQLTRNDVDGKGDNILGLQLDSFANGIQKRIVRFPKQKVKEIIRIKNGLQSALKSDKTLNIAALAMLLKEMMDDE